MPDYYKKFWFANQVEKGCENNATLVYGKCNDFCWMFAGRIYVQWANKGKYMSGNYFKECSFYFKIGNNRIVEFIRHKNFFIWYHFMNIHHLRSSNISFLSYVNIIHLMFFNSRIYPIVLCSTPFQTSYLFFLWEGLDYIVYFHTTWQL